MHPLVRRLSRALASAAALTLLVTPAVAVAAPAGNADGGSPTTVSSAETREAADVPLESSIPTISGIALPLRVGSTLRALAGSWTSGTQFTYQWFADGEAISGATESTFTPTWEHRGLRLTVRLDGSREGYTPVSRTSASSTLIYPGLISVGLPVIVGSATPGATLTAVGPASIPSTVNVRYRWRLDGRSIRGANRSELTMRSAWRGHEITVSAEVDKVGYAVYRVTSPAARVGGAYTRSPNPTISGTLRVGSSLRVARGTWSPTPTSFSFQWYADGHRILGGTSSSYTLKPRDYGKKITVTARSYRAGYGTVLRRSAATSEVLAPARRWVGDDEQARPVGPPDGLLATIYIAQARSAECTWERRSPTEVLGSSVGSGQRLFKVIDTDDTAFASESCGVWIRYYPEMVTPSDETAANGVYALDDHLERGVYSTSGPADAGASCAYTFYKGFYGQDAVIGQGTITEATTITMPSAAVGFETAGCSWKRIG
jgi:hypothetical protein